MPFSFFGLIQPNIKKLKANNDVQGLIEALKYRRDYTIRMGAAEALGGMGTYSGKILPALYNALGDTNGYVRRNVAEAIHAIGADEEGIPYLIDSLDDESWGVSTNVCRSLAALGVKAVPALAQALKHKSRVIRENAVRSLGMMGSNAAQALPNLLDALSAPEFEEKKWVVVEAIGNLGSMARDAVPQLLEVWDEEPEIRGMVETLGKIGAIEAIDPLLKQLFAVSYNQKLWIAKTRKVAYPWGNHTPSTARSRRKDTPCTSLPQMTPKSKLRRSRNRWMNWPGREPVG